MLIWLAMLFEDARNHLFRIFVFIVGEIPAGSRALLIGFIQNLTSLHTPFLITLASVESIVTGKIIFRRSSE